MPRTFLKTCGGKKCYSRRKDARREIRRIQKLPTTDKDRVFDVYTCPYCDSLHIGGSTRKKHA
jgi:hypothetical protein